jgi:hypothetical protein
LKYCWSSFLTPTYGLRAGDHIDLWNKNELASIGFLATWARTIFPSISEFLGMSDLKKSKVILFWEIE